MTPLSIYFPRFCVNKSLPCSNNRNNINGNDPGNHRAHPHDLGCLKISLKWSETAYYSHTLKMPWNLDFLHYIKQKNILVKIKKNLMSQVYHWHDSQKFLLLLFKEKDSKYTKVQELSSINQGDSWEHVEGSQIICHRWHGQSQNSFLIVLFIYFRRNGNVISAFVQ